MAINISKETQKKTGGIWHTTEKTTDAATVYESLANDLIAKKLEKCSYIKSIKRIQNYNGTISIIITYNDPSLYRNIYTVRSY